MGCGGCGTENPIGSRFCEECGTPLATTCPGCGALATVGKKFCASCGTSLVAEPTPSPPPPLDVRVAERRVVSVLFTDLVDFTPLAERRDPEEVRELLSAYFTTARTVVARYGGTIEKFIGDAVMAVWGVPTAHGDDAERAVRAALDLVAAVAALGEDLGVDGLVARAGVVTGEVAVTLGAIGEGMVAGDTVNTAARVQSCADAGQVLVDVTTRQATLASISYDDTGRHALKGKADEVRLWRAHRVVSGIGGSDRIDGLEAAFVGRDRELRSVKDVLHATMNDRRARLVSIVGPAGTGKSRLRWELFKHVDGIADTVLWSTGRCLAYGEGVAYWALAEIVRARLDIAEEEKPDTVAAKLAAGITRWASPEDREFLTPRLGALLGLPGPELDQKELFAGWRLWFERLAEHAPVVLVIEDLQWADTGLLDFLEQLVDWSADSAIFVLALSRPELLDRRPTWAAGRSTTTTLVLDQLPADAMGAIVEDLVPGLPEDVRDRIVDRADGVPLYSVELVRSLIDRDLVQPVDGIYRLVGTVDALATPPSLASLMAARIDALTPEQRALVQGLAVLGGTFPRAAVGAVTDRPEAEVDAMLADLVRKEILRVRSDRTSPDRGQYAFTQSLLRNTAYDTLSRRDRKARHLAVAAHLRSAFPDDGAEMTEVIAQHYLDAYEAMPEDSGAEAIRDEAQKAFARGARRLVYIGAPDRAERAFRTAAELSRSDEENADLIAGAGTAAMHAGRFDEAIELLESAIASHRELGHERAVAESSELLAYAFSLSGFADRAVAVIEPMLSSEREDPPEVRAALHHRLAQALVFVGRAEDAAPHCETALELAQAWAVPEVQANASVTRSFILRRFGRTDEALASCDWAAQVADRHGFTRLAGHAHANAAELAIMTDQLAAIGPHLDATIAVARRRGDPLLEANAVYNQAVFDLFRGRWDEVEPAIAALLARFPDLPSSRLHAVLTRAQLHALRGEREHAHVNLDALRELQSGEDEHEQAYLAMVTAMVTYGAGDVSGAFEQARSCVEHSAEIFGLFEETTRQAWPIAMDTAVRLGKLAEAERLLALVTDLPVGHVPPFLRAQADRFRARLASARGDQASVDAAFRAATASLSELGYTYALAQVQSEHGAWLVREGRAGEGGQLIDAAVATLTALGATPALERIRETVSA